ncbi:hypothetical protein D3C77_458410 [compost metagenome]
MPARGLDIQVVQSHHADAGLDAAEGVARHDHRTCHAHGSGLDLADRDADPFGTGLDHGLAVAVGRGATGQDGVAGGPARQRVAAADPVGDMQNAGVGIDHVDRHAVLAIGNRNEGRGIGFVG